jgi:hypothetical protein
MLSKVINGQVRVRKPEEQDAEKLIIGPLINAD